jgi:hypothetical protein
MLAEARKHGGVILALVSLSDLAQFNGSSSASTIEIIGNNGRLAIVGVKLNPDLEMF